MSEELLDYFLNEVAGVIHVGANIAQECAQYAAFGLNVLWVEPNPQVFPRLMDNICGFPRQRAVQALITDTDGAEYPFHVANNSGASSSILQLHQHQEIWPSIHYVDTLTLTGITLSTLVRNFHIDLNSYQGLILDTQGTELLVLKGSVPILERFDFVKLEVADFESYAGCCQLPEVTSFLTQHGYREVARHQFASSGDSKHYFDIVYQRRT